MRSIWINRVCVLIYFVITTLVPYGVVASNDGTCTVDLEQLLNVNASCVNHTWFTGNIVIQSGGYLDIGYDTIEVNNFTLNTGAILNISSNGSIYGNIKFKCYAFIDGNITLMFPNRVNHQLKNYTLISGPNVIAVSNNTNFYFQRLFNNSGVGGCEDFSIENNIIWENTTSIIITICSFKCKTNTDLIIGLTIGGASFTFLVILSLLMYIVDFARSPKRAYFKFKPKNTLSTIDLNATE